MDSCILYHAKINQEDTPSDITTKPKEILNEN